VPGLEFLTRALDEKIDIAQALPQNGKRRAIAQ
jgi:hypothetical protein